MCDWFWMDLFWKCPFFWPKPKNFVLLKPRYCENTTFDGELRQHLQRLKTYNWDWRYYYQKQNKIQTSPKNKAMPKQQLDAGRTRQLMSPRQVIASGLPKTQTFPASAKHKKLQS